MRMRSRSTSSVISPPCWTCTRPVTHLRRDAHARGVELDDGAVLDRDARRHAELARERGVALQVHERAVHGHERARLRQLDHASLLGATGMSADVQRGVVAARPDAHALALERVDDSRAPGARDRGSRARRARLRRPASSLSAGCARLASRRSAARLFALRAGGDDQQIARRQSLRPRVLSTKSVACYGSIDKLSAMRACVCSARPRNSTRRPQRARDVATPRPADARSRRTCRRRRGPRPAQCARPARATTGRSPPAQPSTSELVESLSSRRTPSCPTSASRSSSNVSPSSGSCVDLEVAGVHDRRRPARAPPGR